MKMSEEFHKKWRGQMLKGLLELFIISYISINPGTYGYQILQRLRGTLVLAADIADDPVYGVLNRLEREGVLEVTKKEAAGRMRKTFVLSSYGEGLFEKILKDWNEVRKLEKL